MSAFSYPARFTWKIDELDQHAAAGAGRGEWRAITRWSKLLTCPLSNTWKLRRFR